MLSKKDVYNAKIKNIDVEIPNTTDLATYACLNAKINVVKGEATNITNLSTTTDLIAFENKIPNVNTLVRKKWLKHKNWWNWK